MIPRFSTDIAPAELQERLASGDLRHYKNYDPTAISSSPHRQMQRFHTMLGLARTRFGSDNVLLGAPLDNETGEVIEDPDKSKTLGVYVTAEAMEADQARKAKANDN